MEYIISWPKKLISKVEEYAINTKMVAQEDPRSIVHSIKAALTLTLVSLFYYLRPLYDGVGVSAMSAILTVVLLFEFTVGATLAKVINRGVATILACALGVGVHYITNFIGDKGEPILLGFIVFIVSTMLSFARFFPRIQQKYDNGVLVFVIVFISISLSGYRVNNILETTYHRLFTVAVGSVICVIISIFICPVWAGEDLHNLLALNMEMLGTFLQEFGSRCTNTEVEEKKATLEGCSVVYDSSSIIESMANFAIWEPRHGAFRFRHPWKIYVKIGNLLRKCAYNAESLHCYYFANSKKNQIMDPYKFVYAQACAEISSECGKALKVLAVSIRTMTIPSTDSHFLKSKSFKTKLVDNIDMMEVIHDTTIASFLNQITTCIDEIMESAKELAHLAHFTIAGSEATIDKP